MEKRGGRPRIDEPHPVDRHVGARVRLRRQTVGLSQEALGSAIGVTFQQVQKYERGTNRISASRLWELSNILEVPVSFFFEGAEGRADMGQDLQGSDAAVDVGQEKEIVGLARSMNAIRDKRLRKSIADLVKSCAHAQDPELS